MISSASDFLAGVSRLQGREVDEKLSKREATLFQLKVQDIEPWHVPGDVMRIGVHHHRVELRAHTLGSHQGSWSRGRHRFFHSPQTLSSILFALWVSGCGQRERKAEPAAHVFVTGPTREFGDSPNAPPPGPAESTVQSPGSAVGQIGETETEKLADGRQIQVTRVADKGGPIALTVRERNGQPVTVMEEPAGLLSVYEDSLGGLRGRLGLPVKPLKVLKVRQTSQPVAYYQRFEHGELWRLENPERLVEVAPPQSSVLDYVNPPGSNYTVRDWLKIPRESVERLAGVSVQRFDGGAIVGDGEHAQALVGAVADRYIEALRSPQQELGQPRRRPFYLLGDGGYAAVFGTRGVLLMAPPRSSSCWSGTRVESTTEPDSNVPMNMCRWLSAHNAFNTKGERNYIRLDTLLAYGVRSLELDVSLGGGWIVNHHPLDTGSSCPTLQTCLTAIRHWIELPGARPSLVTVWLQVNGTDDRAGTLVQALNLMLENSLGPVLYRPKDMLAWGAADPEEEPARDLRKVVMEKGWPKIGTLAGRIMVVVNGLNAENFLRHAASGDVAGQCAFTALGYTTSGVDNTPTCDRNVVFTNFELGASGADWEGKAYRSWLLGQIVRVYPIVNRREWSECAKFFVNHLATNLVPGGKGRWDESALGEHRLREAIASLSGLSLYDDTETFPNMAFTGANRMRGPMRLWDMTPSSPGKR